MAVSAVFVIAEAGVNHNGDPVLARRMVDVAADAGADAVKFQTFHADALAREDAPKAEYQKETTGTTESQYAMLRKLELPDELHCDLAERSRERGIEFLSTAFDERSADLLDHLGMPRFKVASGEITNLPLLQHVAAKRKPVILSTGMSTLPEIGAALGILEKGGAAGITLLHCVSDYPTRPQDVNLRVMELLRRTFGVPVGFSDHTPGASVALAAVALGAVIIEKHFTLDRNLPGPDHRASLDPGALRDLISGIREVEAALGREEKRLTAGEESTRLVARRSLVAAEDLPAGTVLEARHLLAKRPGRGISPMQMGLVIGRQLRSPVNRDSLLSWDLFE